MAEKSNLKDEVIKKQNVTIKDVAKKAKVSIAAVSYVLNGVEKVNNETKLRILKTIEELGYVPNNTARNLAKRQGRLIGILIPIKESYKKTVLTDNPFYQEFISGVEYGAREKGFSTLIIGIENEEDCLNALRDSELIGVMVLGAISGTLYKKLHDVKIPVVVIDQENTDDRFYYINTDDEQGAYIAVKYLIEKGHKNIGFLSGNLKHSIVHRNRFEGYKRALKESNIELREDFVIQTDVTYEGGINASNYIREKRHELTAIFSISDIMALGLIKGLHRQKINVPKDVSVIGFDDIKSSRYFIPELTTIRQDIFGKGEKVVQIITEGSNEANKREFIIPVELIERESVYEFREEDGR
jgi:LacI family transcriptional regulator